MQQLNIPSARDPPSDARNEHNPALAKASLLGEITRALKDGTLELPSLPDIALEVRSAATHNREFKILHTSYSDGVAIFSRSIFCRGTRRSIASGVTRCCLLSRLKYSKIKNPALERGKEVFLPI
jgi:hypothetical protein